MVKLVISGVEFILSERTADLVSKYLAAREAVRSFRSYSEHNDDMSWNDYIYYSEKLWDDLDRAYAEMIGE